MPAATDPAISAHRSRRAATLIGAIAVLLWGTLGPLTVAAGPVPPFQLLAMCFGIGFLVGAAKWVWDAARHGKPILVHLRQPPIVWGLGVAGLFGFHFLYFVSLRNAPPVEANLINYSWPLLIVLFSALLPGERLRWFHLAGAALGLIGAVLLVTGGGAVAFRNEFAFGYALAVCSALTWSSYSVLSRRFGAVPTDAVAGFCLATAMLALLAHLALETPNWPEGAAWFAVLGLGLGPVGLAFYVWDHGVKRGDIQVLGALAYGAPLLSTVLLIAFGMGAGAWYIWAACLAIIGGAVLASKDMVFGARKG